MPAATFTRLRRLVERREPAPGAPAEEQCDLCAQPLPGEHRHLLDLSDRSLLCACSACRLLFEDRPAGGDRYRLVPARRWHLADLALDDAAWRGLGIPVDMAFFTYHSGPERIVAGYPSPAGATESLPDPSAWAAIVDRNPVLGLMRPDLEALLVNRMRRAREHWLVPIDDCYRLVGLIRSRWRGLGGGSAVWDEVAGFLGALRGRAEPVHRNGTRWTR